LHGFCAGLYLKETMKTFSIFFSSALLLGLSTSCSRQVISLNSTSELKTLSILGVKPEIVQAQKVNIPPKTENSVATAAIPENTVQNRPDSPKLFPNLNKRARIRQIVKNESNTVRTLVLNQLNDLTLSQKHAADRGYPQINKAGFIFVAAGILGLLLHLILVACIVLIVIGLIVLLSPLLHKRY